MEQKIKYIENENSIDSVIINGKPFLKKEIYKYYIEEMRTIKELGEILGIKKSSVHTLLNKLKISKKVELGEDFRSSEEYKEKSKKRCLEKYGVESLSQLESTKQKARLTCLKKYGVEYVAQAEEVKKKAEETLFSHYGVKKALQSKEILEKLYEKNEEKYGCRVVFSNEGIKKKIEETNIKKYGVKNPFSNEEIQQKIHETNKKKYGTSIYKQKDIKNLDIWEDKEKFEKFLVSSKEKKTTFEIAQFFNCEETAVRNKIHFYNLDDKVLWNGNRSQYEKEIISWLEEDLGIKEIINNDKQHLGSGKKEIDIFLPQYKFGIEFNGDYWHSEIMESYQDHGGRSTRHQEKSLLAEKRGIFLFHIFEREWVDERTQKIIKSRIKNILGLQKEIIPAKKCEIKEVSKNEKKKFLEENHIQGQDRSSVCLGLYYKGEIVSCMTFKKSKNNYSWELSRFCNKIDTVIVGGASKLFKSFIEKHGNKGETIVSYSDFSKAKGDLYKTLGFQYRGLNAPNYVWINFQTGDIRSRYQEQLAGEVERMHSQEYYRVCDCGTKTWVYKI